MPIDLIIEDPNHEVLVLAPTTLGRILAALLDRDREMARLQVWLDHGCDDRITRPDGVPMTDELREELTGMLREGPIIPAIKRLRAALPWLHLAEAKVIVDHLNR